MNGRCTRLASSRHCCPCTRMRPNAHGYHVRMTRAHRRVEGERRADATAATGMTLQGSTPLDASWRRVERLDTPPADDHGPWELVEDKTELMSLDVSAAAHTAGTHLGAAPGTEVVLTVRIVRWLASMEH